MADRAEKTFTISALAKAGQVNVQTVRYYEREGILKPVGRRDSGYRIYNEDSLRRLHFIRQAKELGFSLEEIQSLLKLRVRSVEGCTQVRSRAESKLKDVQLKIAQLRKLERNLMGLISDCENRVVSDCCPIIEKMED